MDPYSDPRAFFACLPHLPQPSGFPSPSEARKRAQQLSTDILFSWRTLADILDRHEAVLRKRWLKKTKEQRKKTLLSVLPEIPPTHRPDFDAFRKGLSGQRGQKSGSLAAYMRPYINLEDLTEAKVLLIFLNARGRNPPYMFAHADYDAAHLGFVTGTVCPEFLNCYTMFLDGVTPRDYGRMVSWDSDPEASDIMFSGRGVQPGEGLLAFQIQKCTMDFLVACCHAILHDMNLDTLVGPNIPIQLEPPAIERDSTEWLTIASVAAESPYRVPANINFERLLVIFSAKRSAVIDHILALREDPGYFYETMGEASEHRIEAVLDSKRMRDPSWRTPLFWARVYHEATIRAHESLVVWDYLYRQVEELVTLRKKYASQICPKKKLPGEYMRAPLTLRMALDETSKTPISNLKMAIFGSPSMRSAFVRIGSVTVGRPSPVTTKSGTVESYFLWLFRTMWDDYQLFLCRLPDLMDEIERLIESDPKEKEKMSNLVANTFSDLGLLASTLREINTYHPWASGMESEAAKCMAEIDKNLRTQLSLAVEIGMYGKEDDLLKLQLETPLDGKFTYPSDKRRTQQHVEAMRRAEENLDLFWEKIDQHYKKKSGKTLLETLQHLLPRDRTLKRTPEWVPPTTKPTSTPEPHLSQSFCQLSIQDENRRPAQPVTEKAKIKTRRIPSVEESDTESSIPHHGSARHIPDIQPILRVSKRALKVFSILFHKPSESDQAGEIPWSDFLHAMVSTGFGPTKLYGSVWQFTPTKLDVSRSIQFHEPHPRSKIPFQMARRFGRRLNRAYGWNADMFALAG
ncbi:hypothetical protein FQN50_004428 [Emmonsiellopsis sp. PD_5]|nr:hypothetical protein FQN50_004428 [Emmonsiellopsis sp. PD_5]